MAKKRRVAPKKVKKQNRARVLIVEARYYEHIAEQLLAGAMAALEAENAEVDRVTVPGALEIPPAIAIAVEAAALRRQPYDGVVALGCVIQGETFHFDIVATQSARALMDFAVTQRLPAGNGILTVDNEAQALRRAAHHRAFRDRTEHRDRNHEHRRAHGVAAEQRASICLRIISERACKCIEPVVVRSFRQSERQQEAEWLCALGRKIRQVHPQRFARHRIGRIVLEEMHPFDQRVCRQNQVVPSGRPDK
jgi:6,7-dimethyl-8-ribityllumazine synthase